MKKVSNKNNAHNFLIVIAIILYVIAIFSVVIGFNDVFDSSVVEQSGSYREVEYRLDLDDTSYFTNAAVFFVWGTVLLMISRKVKSNNQNTNIDESAETMRMPQGIEEKPDERIYCAYCDNELDDYNKKCPYCGASRKIRKKL